MEEHLKALGDDIRPMITLDAHQTIGYNLDRDDGFWIQQAPAGSGWIIKIYIVNLLLYVPIDSDLDKRGQLLLFSQYSSNTIITSLFGEAIERKASFMLSQSRKALEVSCFLDNQLIPQNIQLNFCQAKNLCALDNKSAQRIFMQRNHQFYSMLAEVAKINWLLKRKRQNYQGTADWHSSWINQPDRSWQQEMPPDYYRANNVVPELMVLANALLTNYVHQHFGLLLYRNTIQPDQVVSSHSPQGHSMLKLPAYGRFTSPLRSYGDLINLRLLQAALANKPLPYSANYLSALANSLNNKEEEIKNHGSKIIQEWSAPVDQSTTVDKNTQWRQQVREHSIDSSALYDLIFKHKPEWWLEIIDYLKEWPAKATSLLNLAEQGKVISALDYTVQETADSQWSIAVSFRCRDQSRTTKACIQADKKSAKQKASLEAIELWLSS